MKESKILVKNAETMFVMRYPKCLMSFESVSIEKMRKTNNKARHLEKCLECNRRKRAKVVEIQFSTLLDFHKI